MGEKALWLNISCEYAYNICAAKCLRALREQLDDTEVSYACKAETAKNRAFFVVFVPKQLRAPLIGGFETNKPSFTLLLIVYTAIASVFSSCPSFLILAAMCPTPMAQ